ncbi:hypothetical protein FACS189465_2750 [Clostridia bacterium]|nr:hypothetical protein FACS189465_2750 [Clostridia bacterium]
MKFLKSSKRALALFIASCGILSFQAAFCMFDVINGLISTASGVNRNVILKICKVLVSKRDDSKIRMILGMSEENYLIFKKLFLKKICTEENRVIRAVRNKKLPLLSTEEILDFFKKNSLTETIENGLYVMQEEKVPYNDIVWPCIEVLESRGNCVMIEGSVDGATHSIWVNPTDDAAFSDW